MNEPRQFRPRRSALYMPGSNERALEKARSLDVDVLIFDLEDAVAPDAKSRARDLVAAAVAGGGYGSREVVVRVNSLDSEWGAEDLKMVAASRPDAALLPKVSSAQDLVAAARALEGALEKDARSEDSDHFVRLWAMMETPLAMLNAQEIAASRTSGSLLSCPQLSCLVMGTNDLAKETGARLSPGRAPMTPWLMTCVAAARAYGLDVIDGVYNDFQDLEGFGEECRQAASMGFDGKTLIHPKQVEICNEAFSPSAEEVRFARLACEAFDLPENAEKGVVRIEGRMVERLHAEMGRRVLSIAEAMAAR